MVVRLFFGNFGQVPYLSDNFLLWKNQFFGVKLKSRSAYWQLQYSRSNAGGIVDYYSSFELSSSSICLLVHNQLRTLEFAIFIETLVRIPRFALKKERRLELKRVAKHALSKNYQTDGTYSRASRPKYFFHFFEEKVGKQPFLARKFVFRQKVGKQRFFVSFWQTRDWQTTVHDLY